MLFGAMQERVYHGRKFSTVDRLKQAIVLEWRALSRRFIDLTGSDNGNVFCSMSWIRMANTLNARFTKKFCIINHNEKFRILLTRV